LKRYDFQYRKQAGTIRACRALGITAVVLVLTSAPRSSASTIKTNLILGSSVAQGYNASGTVSNPCCINGSIINSYGALLTQMLATNGWWGMNRSIAGNNTTDVIQRFSNDVPRHVDVILIGLSLGNEGLAGSPNPQAVYNHFLAGISNLVWLTYQNGSLPLLGGVYPRDQFDSTDYVYLKNMVLQFNTFNIPSINFLGATDNGHGHWIPSMDTDGLHPNDFGHDEMFLSIVPTVFDALKAGKPTPQWGNPSRFVRVTGDPTQSAPFSFNPGSTVHSFAMSFSVRTSATGTVASVTLPGSGAQPTVEITPTGLIYVPSNGQIVNSGVTATDGAWHNIVVSHQYGGGQTWFYVDGVLAGTASEQLTPTGFVLGGPGNATTRPGSPTQADYQNWFIHRSMLNVEEVTAQYQGALQQQSLEFYSPLDDTSFPTGGTLPNRAQSLSVATINGAMLSASPTATFSANPSSGLAPLTVTFTDTSIGPITNWFWDFGDGGTTNLATNIVTYTYATAGVYSVTEFATGTNWIGSLTRSNLVNVLAALTGFVAAPTNGLAPLTVTFTDTSIGPITNWFWDFGDGGTASLATNSVTYTYTTTGVYSVTEIVTATTGSSSLTQSNLISVVPPPPPSFVAAPTNGFVPLTVTFTDTSTSPITNWFWDFGDGGTTNLATNSVTYTYTTTGVYSVTEIITTTNWSSSLTQSNLISVVPVPPPGFVAAPTSGRGPLTVTFMDTTVGSITNWFWDFGDGDTTNLAINTVTYTYATAGVYSVTESITGAGWSASVTQSNYINVAMQFPDWQVQYFGPNNPNADPGADADGTGQNNQFKYITGLDPTNPASIFTLAIAAVTNAPNQTCLTYNPVAGGRTYTPQFATNLVRAFWRNLTTTTGPVTNLGQVTVVDTNATTAAKFYRIQISLP